MRALTIVDGAVVVAERPDPRPGRGEVLVRVRGAGINRADLARRSGRYPAPPGAPPDIPGLEFAGEVVALGDGVQAPSIGTRVFGIVAGGAQAELVAVPAVHCVEVPATLGDVAAGGVPEVFITAHDALVTQGGAAPGETVLVHAAGSGVGTAAVQLAHLLGCTTVGTSRTAAKLERCRELGLDHAVEAPREPDPVALADQITAVVGAVELTLELVGGGYLTTDLRVAADRGRIVVVASEGGNVTEINLSTTMLKRLRIQGTVLGPRSLEDKAAAIAAFATDVVPRLAEGSLRPVIAETFALEEATTGYEVLGAGAVFGKVVLDVSR